MTPVSRSIQRRLPVPVANITSMSAQQQPRQSRACRNPSLQAPAGLLL
jgi:hypothetical protein